MNQYVAIYLRLSKADKRNEVSESIQNQNALLQRFCRQDQELCHYETKLFVDDGYSGLEENRPALQELLQLVKQGRISVVLVKDFSRLSRNHLYLAMLREQFFPMYCTEVISLGDGYDSREKRDGELAMRFKGLFYEYYSRDISRKVKTALAAKKEKGEYAVARAPFGYRRQGEDWKVEEREAVLIRKIFLLAAQGKNCQQIVKLLEKESGDILLYPVKIWRILHNPVYCGMHVWHKYENKMGYRNKSVSLPMGQWNMAEGRQEAIISKELFKKVQKILK